MADYYYSLLLDSDIAGNKAKMRESKSKRERQRERENASTAQESIVITSSSWRLS